LNNYIINNPWDWVTHFECAVAERLGSKYGVAIDCASNGFFLAFKYLKAEGSVINLPRRNYASVPMQAIHAGCRIRWTDELWKGDYILDPLPIVDSAVRFTENCYRKNTYTMISFHERKRINIGKGGMILTDDKDFVDWCRPMIHDGRDHFIDLKDDYFRCIGYKMYMTAEQAKRGLEILDRTPLVCDDTDSALGYHDLSLQSVFDPYVVK
jgi:dTDP-4-amino-4,6-dideoxygalactose transaminase